MDELHKEAKDDASSITLYKKDDDAGKYDHVLAVGNTLYRVQRYTSKEKELFLADPQPIHVPWFEDQHKIS